MVANLKKAYDKPRTKRRSVVMKLLKEIAARHSKANYYDVKIDNAVTKEIYKHGSRFPLKRIKIKLNKDEKTGVVMVTLPETKANEKPKEEKTENKMEKKQEEATAEKKKK